MLDATAQRQGVTAGEVVVQDEHVGAAALELAHERDLVAGRGEHLHLARVLQQSPEPGPYGDMVVQKSNADHRTRAAGRRRAGDGVATASPEGRATSAAARRRSGGSPPHPSGLAAWV